jgi:hypothetical protein
MRGHAPPRIVQIVALRLMLADEVRMIIQDLVRDVFTARDGLSDVLAMQFRQLPGAFRMARGVAAVNGQVIAKRAAPVTEIIDGKIAGGVWKQSIRRTVVERVGVLGGEVQLDIRLPQSLLSGREPARIEHLNPLGQNLAAVQQLATLNSALHISQFHPHEKT